MTHPEKPTTDVLELFYTKKLVKVCAPMVRYSKLQFRNLVSQYCDLTFTPMILADSFCKSNKARSNEFTTNLIDTPVITQFAANTVHDFVGASYMVAPYCDGVDLNCGCPQRWARDMNLGCQMLKDPQKIFELVRECRNRIAKPFTISVKTRIQQDDRESVKVCQALEKCGVSFMTIHARTPDNNSGSIKEESLKLIVDSVNVPVIGNGGVVSLDGCYDLQEKTGVKGVMVANALLSNPLLFAGSKSTSLECVQEWLDICYNSTLTLETYDETVCRGTIPERPPNLTFQCFHHHLVFMLDKVFTRRQKKIFNNLTCFKDALEFLDNTFGLRPQLFTREQFMNSVPLQPQYEGREWVYKELKPFEDSKMHVKDFIEYDYEESKGKLFMDKCKELEGDSGCDWTEMFFEKD
ncbi:tRNA-dihydrouridine(20a/20b) synthase [NAD(P)+]-like [Anthonomus grandis grandis]|uniref:tRNA-dihydrouridine(20a/20b) synthase [NAD(P)+]-like n=1 Tax=Anthonomus grandis grandis TaxID=2921223 RepID=UPI002165CF6A|nr:tRNA-dihydrouridine(20a/20b) synthase [NAD(P)+]-like [Anthonomus grandis grandis]